MAEKVYTYDDSYFIRRLGRFLGDYDKKNFFVFLIHILHLHCRKLSIELLRRLTRIQAKHHAFHSRKRNMCLFFFSKIHSGCFFLTFEKY